MLKIKTSDFKSEFNVIDALLVHPAAKQLLK